MKNTKEESLTNVNEKGIFYKIKMFFRKMTGKDSKKEEITYQKTEVKEETNSFKENIRNSENSHAELLKLQQRFRNGEIKNGDLTQEQIDKLCELYDSQIQSLKISIEMRRRRIEDYRNRKTRKI